MRKATTVFKNGPSTQAVRIPKEFRIDATEVWIEKVEDGILLKPKPKSWDDFFNDAQSLSDDFEMKRGQQSPQKRGKAFE